MQMGMNLMAGFAAVMALGLAASGQVQETEKAARTGARAEAVQYL